jgi:hypothetical protein
LDRQGDGIRYSELLLSENLIIRFGGSRAGPLHLDIGLLLFRALCHCYRSFPFGGREKNTHAQRFQTLFSGNQISECGGGICQFLFLLEHPPPPLPPLPPLPPPPLRIPTEEPTLLGRWTLFPGHYRRLRPEVGMKDVPQRNMNVVIR